MVELPAGRGERVDVDVAGEPVGRSLLGVDAAAGDLHGLLVLALAQGGLEDLFAVLEDLIDAIEDRGVE